MTRAVDSGLAALRSRVAGQVLLPGDDGYDDARRLWNAQVDRRPAVVVVCTSAADVSAALLHAREHGLQVSVRGGGHNTAGSAVVDGGLMINLSRLDRVEVDPVDRIAFVGGGALLGQLDAAAQEHGLATPAGLISHTGVGGLTLGGGMGWLTRKHGLTLDNVIGVEVVLADGSVVRADPLERSDLFWAVRGGGGNFGVVTTFEVALHRVGPMVDLGFFFWPADSAGQALRDVRGVLEDLPRELNAVIAVLGAPPAPFVPAEHVGSPGVALLLVGFSGTEEHQAVAALLREAAPPLFEAQTPIPYVALQQMQDEHTRWGQFAYEKGTQLATLSDGAIDVLVEAVTRRSSPLSLSMLYRLDGAYAEVEEDATAYGGGRTPRWATMLVGLSSDMTTFDSERQWVRDQWLALQPHSLGIGDYVNNMVEVEPDRVRASYGPEKHARLAAIKAVYDPDNTFRTGVNIPPAP